MQSARVAGKIIERQLLTHQNTGQDGMSPTEVYPDAVLEIVEEWIIVAPQVGELQDALTNGLQVRSFKESTSE